MPKTLDDEQIKDIAAAYWLLDRIIDGKVDEHGEDNGQALHKAAVLLKRALQAQNITDEHGNVLEEYKREDHGYVGNWQA